MGRDFAFRALSFELLESKALPGSLLLAFAPLDEDLHGAAARLGLFGEAGSPGVRSSAAMWSYQHSTEELLRFVEENTDPGEGSPLVWHMPSPEQCAAADEMMKLSDDNLRAMVAAESVDASHFVFTV
jgi:hypothetical protein